MLRVEKLFKTFLTSEGQVRAVKGVSFEVGKGQFFTLLGPSGCGKTTILRCVAGLEVPDWGEIWIDGKSVCLINEKTRMTVPAYKRDVGMVFQSYAIWPHLTVFGNVAFPLLSGNEKLSKAEIGEKVRYALKLVRLEGFEERPAPFLSGGQQQRVALARALVYEPKLLLLDEPLSNLDLKLRLEMRQELRELTERLDVTAVFVTHDQEEALALSDRIALMQDGEIIEEGNPWKIYAHPSNPVTAAGIGSVNWLEGEVIAEKTEAGAVLTPLGQVLCQVPKEMLQGEKVKLAFRPEDVSIHAEMCERASNVWRGTVERLVYVGKRSEYTVCVDGQLIQCESGAHIGLKKGQSIGVEIHRERILVFRVG